MQSVLETESSRLNRVCRNDAIEQRERDERIAQPQCPTCNRAMLPGFVLTPGEKGNLLSIWVEGQRWQYEFYGGNAYPIVTY